MRSDRLILDQVEGHGSKRSEHGSQYLKHSDIESEGWDAALADVRQYGTPPDRVLDYAAQSTASSMGDVVRSRLGIQLQEAEHGRHHASLRETSVEDLVAQLEGNQLSTSIEHGGEFTLG